MRTWDAVGAPGAISQRLTKEGVVADQPGLRVKSVPLPDLCGVLRVNVSPRNLGSLAKVPGNHMSNVGEPLPAADWSQSGSQTWCPGRMRGGLPGQYFLIPDVRQKVKQREVQEHLDSKGSRGHARGRGARARGQTLVRGISWPPLGNTEPGGTPGHSLAPNVLAETAGGINTPPQVVPEETPTRHQQQQQGNKRKGDELTPPENAALSDGELFLPRRLEVEEKEKPRHQTVTTAGEGKGTASPSGEEEAAQTLLGARQKRQKRCTAIVKGNYLEDDSEAGESGSEWSAQGSNRRPTKNPLVGKRKVRAGARSPKKIPQGAGPVEYRLMTASDLGAQLMEWLEDIDAVRMRCKSMQGRLSGEIKRKVGLAKEALLTLTVKAEAAGDPALLQARNTDLEAQLRDTRRERDELQRELEKNRQGRERPQTEIANRATSSYAQVASRGPVARAGERRSEAAQTTMVLDLGAATRRSEVEANEGPTTATSAGASEFELRLTGSELRLIPDSDRVRDEEMARQSAALKQVREEVGRISLLLLDASSKSGAADQDPLGKGTAQPRGKQATTEKVQRSSGDRGATDTPMEVDDGADAENGRGGWSTKRKRKGKRLGVGVPSGAAVEATQTAPTGALRRTGEDRPTVARRKAPRTAAVAIKSREENTPYAEILKFAREKIQLAELGIEETRVRRAANGGVLIEIPGPENTRKADALAAQLTRVILDKYGNAVSVTRPVIKGELRVLGLDDSVSTEELARTLAEQGGCKVEEVRVGVPRRTPNGLYSAWAQCPLRAAVAVAKKGKVRIGWTTARVELLEARPRQCYKCWGFGHIGSMCKASTERRAACYRCSAEGHQARDCTANPKCAVCEGRGIDSAHRMGSGRCTSVGERGRRPATNASENGQQVVLEREIDVCLVSEPYATPSVATWLSSDDGRAAIYWRAEGNVRGGSLVKRGRGYVAAKFGDIIAISVYISPNILIAEFTEHLDDLARVIQIAGNSGRGVLVGGDFNARSPTWDPSGSNRRGELLEEWAASCCVRLHNAGRTATCIRAQGSSVVDLTWSSVNLVPVIKGWRVLEETETLSDHRYISYEVGTPRRAEHRGRKGHMRWNWSKFSPEHLTDALSLTLSWGPTGGDYTTPEGLAGWIERAMTQACDAAAPRARTGNRSRKATYWWSEELADIRRSCIAARRRLARGRRTADDRQEKEAEYRAAKRVLRDGIKAAKAKAWRDLISSVEADPWGLSYKLVLGKLRSSQRGLTETLEENTLRSLLDALFPRGDGCVPRAQSGCRWDERWAVTADEVRAALKKACSRNVAPGPDGVKGSAWAKVPEGMIALLSRNFSLCLREGVVPLPWKKARLVLIPKGGAPTGPIPKVRPICLLNEVGKMFERILVARLGKWMEGNPRACLSEDQYGFREGRSTNDALLRVRRFVENATENGGYAVAVSLDIANAFNSLPWPSIRDALEDKAAPEYLRRVLDSYLWDRYVEYTNGDGELRSLAVTAGVPQGSVLGPLLWNLTFDEVLRGEGVADCAIVCYADDTLVLSSAGDPSTAVALANAMVARVVRRISGLGLTVAASKTEAVLFRRLKRGDAPNTPDVRVGAERVLLSGSMKYLGVRLDPGLTFKAHFASMETRLGGVTRTLARLMPNLRGPSESRRRLYAQTLFAVIMYGAPVWGDVARSSKYIQQVITRCQRGICARVVAAYRTASFVAVSMLARTPPLYLVANAYERTFHRVRELRSTRTWSQSMAKAIREEELRVAREQWRVDLGSAGLPSERLRLAILANWTGWFDRAHGSMTFRVTQVLTGHGYFADFLYRIGKTERPTCWYCRLEEDTVSHTVEACPAWRDERDALKRVVGEDLTPPGLIRAMVGSREGWVAVASFAERVMTAKEQRERLRQRTQRSVHRATRVSGRNGGGSRVSAGMT
ncbi:uncharacterized protein LOC124309827 [Neodiprion virginianus]|uniref:uncharacterized protein LOC124309827 n=1 Tax=Neodiprion virginianus TaxID=2961670 RepID=UPI001EE73EB6|nr:uncharacterized protein LOC124309827 [Neodiprion virginianus]